MTGTVQSRSGHGGRRLLAALLLSLVAPALAMQTPAARGGDGPAEGCGRRPIVFLHGHFYTNASLSLLIDRFQADGWPRDRLATIKVSRKTCTRVWADALAAKIAVLTRATGCPKVDIVAHSRGGLAAREYIRRAVGEARLAHLVTLGTPHHGAAFNRACLGCGCLEMRPGSDFLDQLNAGDETPAAAVTSIYSRHDEIVSAESAWLSGARNVEVRGVKHSDLLRSRRVYGEIRAGLM